MKRSLWELLAAGMVVLITDQGSKWWVRWVGKAVLNDGGVFGLGRGFFWVPAVLVVLLMAGWWGFKAQKVGEKLGWTVILIAGASNLIDRLIYGGVWDFIYYPWIEVAGNLADIWLLIGVIILLTQRLNIKNQSDISKYKKH